MNHEVFSPEQQRRVFEDLCKNSHKGIPGVTYVQGATRKQFLLSILTHGNEPSGLASAHAILDDASVRNNLKGDVVITVNNVEAATRFFAADSAEEKRKHRGYEMNMNRMPEDILDRKGAKELYEIRRTHELMPVFRDASVGLDIHSYTQEGPPMIIDTKGEQAALDALNDSIPIRDRITNIIALQTGYSIGCLFGGLMNRQVPAIAVETGSHEHPDAMRNAKRIAISTLIGAGFLDEERDETEDTQQVYRTVGSFKFPSMNYALLRTHKPFGFIAEDEVIAKGDGKDIIAAQDCITLFGADRLTIDTPAQLADERMFLTLPPRNRPRTLLQPRGV